MRETLAGDPILALAEPQLLAHPYPAYAWLRENQPVFWYERLGSWMVTRHADCVAVLRDGDHFTADWRRIGEEIPARSVSIQVLDPPEHTTVRRLFVDALRTRPDPYVEQLITDEANRRYDELRARPSFDFVTEFAEPLSLLTIARYLGIPALDPTWFLPTAAAISAGMDAGLWPDRVPALMAASSEYAERAGGWLDDPAATGPVRVVADRLADSGVDRGVAANTLRVLMHAGYTSASKLLGLAVAGLLETPGRLAALRTADRVLAIEELVRYASPVQAMARACVADTTIGGVAVSAGQAVTLLLGAANRDPVRFPDPDTVRLDRTPNPHLGFGRGPHACIGSRFAATQAAVVLRTLAERFPASRIVDPPEYQRNLTLRSLDRLTISLT